MDDLQRTINYKFNDLGLLEQALTHSSYSNEQAQTSPGDYQRMEFLGDAILGAVIAHALFLRFPEQAEGKLSQYKSELVCEASLAHLARDLGLQDRMRMGNGELANHGNERASVLSDCYEAIIAGIYLDGGFAAAETFVLSQFEGHLSKPQSEWAQKDAKSRLQEWVQSHGFKYCYVEVEDESDPKIPFFVVEVYVNGEVIAKGEGSAKKRAEQDAAAKALEHLNGLE